MFYDTVLFGGERHSSRCGNQFTTDVQPHPFFLMSHVVLTEQITSDMDCHNIRSKLRRSENSYITKKQSNKRIRNAIILYE